jgi:hypothetical protein
VTGEASANATQNEASAMVKTTLLTSASRGLHRPRAFEYAHGPRTRPSVLVNCIWLIPANARREETAS